MAIVFGLKLHPLSSTTSLPPKIIASTSTTTTNIYCFNLSTTTYHSTLHISRPSRILYSRYNNYREDEEEDAGSFEDAVALFNRREYYKCHDLLEALWMKSEDPTTTLLHAILQCAVGFHHLFNQNHKGAMLELGEGLCKLRKMNFESGPFHQFELQIGAVLEFVYQTQIEWAACADDLCLAMDRSERSYQLLGGYGGGQLLYTLQNDDQNATFIVFCPQTQSQTQTETDPARVRLPVLEATQHHLMPYISSSSS